MGSGGNSGNGFRSSGPRRSSAAENPVPEGWQGQTTLPVVRTTTIPSVPQAWDGKKFALVCPGKSKGKVFWSQREVGSHAIIIALLSSPMPLPLPPLRPSGSGVAGSDGPLTATGTGPGTGTTTSAFALPPPGHGEQNEPMRFTQARIPRSRDPRNDQENHPDPFSHPDRESLRAATRLPPQHDRGRVRPPPELVLFG